MNDNCKQRDLNDLSPTEFEEFCFDLLESMGYINLKWRKGTGHNSSPADGGRDIECELARVLPGDSHELEKWFVECKHGMDAVSKERIHGILVAADAFRPDRVLIIASNYLSNPAKDWLKEWQANNKSSFSIMTWERKDIERQMSSRPRLLRKYGLAGEFPVLSILHPAHIRYLKLPPPNSLGYFFDILDSLSPQERDRFFFYFDVVNPKVAQPPPNFKGTMGDLLLDPCNYRVFKNKCYKLVELVTEPFLVRALVCDALQYLLSGGDPTGIEAIIHSHQETIDFFKKRISEGKGKREVLENLIVTMQRMQRETPENIGKGFDNYVSFCEKVVTRLFEEKITPHVPETMKQAIDDIGG